MSRCIILLLIDNDHHCIGAVSLPSPNIESLMKSRWLNDYCIQVVMCLGVESSRFRKDS